MKNINNQTVLPHTFLTGNPRLAVLSYCPIYLLLSLIFCFFLLPSFLTAQGGPCDSQRWKQGASWDDNGNIVDPAIINGIIDCGTSSNTQSKIKTDITYSPQDFAIDVKDLPCINPINGNTVSIDNPTIGADIIWFNFDVRALSGNFNFQLSAGGDNNNVGWALFYSNNPTNSLDANGVSGDCTDIAYFDCGIGFSGWATHLVPDYFQTTNFYLAIWKQDGDDWKKGLNVFKARYGCGELFDHSQVLPPPCEVSFSEIQDIGLNSSGDNWAASWGDFNGDGAVDLLVTNDAADAPNELYQNNGNGTFTQITTGPIATDLASSLGASWADYDNDQDLDLFVANNIGEPNFLYRNEGGNNFIRIYDDPIVSDIGYAHGASWADYDNDGFLDLFVSSYFSTKFNLLYHNNGDGTFTSITDNAIAMEASNSTAGFWADYNNDGLIDLFVANNLGDNNSLYENKGNGVFLKINAGEIVNDGGNSVGASWGDYDNDQDLDLFVANAGDENNFLYQNNGNGTFTKVTTGAIANDLGHSHGSGWADYNNDGWLDLFVANDQNQDNFLYENNKNGTFTKVDNIITQSAGQSFGASWADYDNDGSVDLFVANREGNPNFVYKNETSGCGRSACVTLVGTNSNRSAIGAKIFLKTTIDGVEVTQLREVSAQSGGGIGGQAEFKAIFGVGDAQSLDEITVQWPSGHIQILTQKQIDPCLIIQEENGSKVCGIIYNDTNGNCTKDANEEGVPNQKILLNPGNHVVFSDENGVYEAVVPIGNYDIITEPIDNWALSCANTQSALSVAVSVLGNQYCGNDVGLQASCLAPDMTVEAAVTSHRVGFENLISLTFGNKGTMTANDVTLQLELDIACIPLSSTIPWDSQDGQTLFWYLESIPAGYKQTIYITDSVDATTPIGQELSLSTQIDANEVDCDEEDNTFVGFERSIGALDPNDILVSPEGSIKKDEVLTYKIRFQNVGNLPVSTVRIENVLPKELDKYTFELGVGSHPFRFNQNGRTLFWEFPNINLPDSIHNEKESHGYVTFRIRPKTSLPIGAEIENSANIFFDNMAPIETNVVKNVILPDLATEKFGGKLMVYPNPTRGKMNIQLIPNKFGQLPDIMRHLFVYNMLGQPVKSVYNLKDNDLSWDATGLPAGFYLIKAINQKGEEFDAKVYVIE